MFSVYYLHGHFGLSFGNLKLLFKRDKSLLCKYYHEIKNINPENPNDKGMLRYRDKFDLLVTDFTLKQKQ